MKKGLIRVILTLLPYISVVAVVFSAVYFVWARQIGLSVGTSRGEIVGVAIGSWQGITSGIEEGKNNGIEDGVSAKDTRVGIQNEIKSIGKLEVLHADVTMHNRMTIGEDNPSYKEISVISGDAVFFIDLEKTVFKLSNDGKTVIVLLPDIEHSIEYDPNVEVLYSAQHFNPFTGAGAGAQAVINSFGNLNERAEETIGNYSFLEEKAKTAAINQVKTLAKAFSFENIEYEVLFSSDLG